MTISAARLRDLEKRLAEAEATIRALLAGEIDAVIDSVSTTPVLLGHAQSELRESEERYRRIVETAHEGISIVAPDGTFTFANQRFAELLGRSVDEIIGQSLFRFVPDADRAAAELRLAHSQQGASEEHEVVYLRADGTELWTLLRTTPVRDGDGRFVGTLGMTTDRTRSRQAEDARRKSEAQYRQIVEATSDGIIQVDERDVIVFVNLRLAEMLGYTPAEMIGRRLYDFMNPDAQALVAEHLRLRKLGSKSTVQNAYRHRDGTDVSVSISGTALFDDDGRFVGTLGIVRDDTERNRLQAQLMVSDRMASIGTLAAGLAHEINNPLAAVMANLDFIAGSLQEHNASGRSALSPARNGTWLRDEINGPLGDAREAARRMRFLVRDLKVFSRSADETAQTLVDVGALMESSLRMADNEIRHRAHVVRQYGAVPGVRASEARLGQVFINLLVNAAQALPEGHADQNEIRVSTRLDHERVLVDVSDTGPGIPPALVGRIFDAFFTTKQVGGGTGLGLAISHRIVTDLGGDLTVESTMGRGTTFRVALPIASMEKADEVPPVEPAVSTHLRGRILLVDDEEMLLRVLGLILSDDHEVVATATAREALALCTGGQKFDLILCDLMMPQMTGMDLHRELSRIDPDQASRIIFLTGGAFTSKAQQFLSDGPKEYIEKPFDTSNLRAIVQRHLRANA